jgi:hypothetical protein
MDGMDGMDGMDVLRCARRGGAAIE